VSEKFPGCYGSEPPIGSAMDANKDSKLARKFRTFASTLEGFQNLDVRLAKVPEGKRADFLFRGGEIVAEMKDINTEAQDAWLAYTREGQRLAEKYGFHPDHDPCPWDKFTHDERGLFWRLISKFTRRFERYLSEAHRQVESTKAILELESAGGMLVLVNGRSGMTLFHGLMAAIIRQFENGAAEGRFSQINGVFFAQSYVGYTIEGFDAGAAYMETRYVNQSVTAFGHYMSAKWHGWHHGVGTFRSGFLRDIPLPDPR
jgi:hypothetical protein